MPLKTMRLYAIYQKHSYCTMMAEKTEQMTGHFPLFDHKKKPLLVMELVLLWDHFPLEAHFRDNNPHFGTAQLAWIPLMLFQTAPLKD